MFFYLVASVICDDETEAIAAKSQLEFIARPMYSSPPVHGSLLVTEILSNPDLKELWFKEVKVN
jgi:aspartate aminotransferase